MVEEKLDVEDLPLSSDRLRPDPAWPPAPSASAGGQNCDGIGGGSILASILVSTGLSVRAVAPAALASTYPTSAVGVLSYALLSLEGEGDIAPDWVLALFLGAGGLIGGYVGASVQGQTPDQMLRRILGLLALALGLRYLALGIA